MRNLKVILIIVLGFALNSFFNGCGEVRFGNLYDDANTKIGVTEPNIDEPDEVALINEIFGVPPEMVEGEYEDEAAAAATEDYAADEESADEDSDSDDDSESSDDDDKNQKVVICHIPKGNPDKAHTLVVSWSAVRAHVEENHHRAEGDVTDYFGACGENEDEESADEDEEEEVFDVDL